MDEYYTVKSECSAEITEKKSRFIATIRHVSSEDEALYFIQEMKKEKPGSLKDVIFSLLYSMLH